MTFKTLKDWLAEEYETLTPYQKNIVDRSKAHKSKKEVEKQERLEARERILEMLGESSMTQTEIVKAIGRSHIFVRRILDDLRQEGIVSGAMSSGGGNRITTWSLATSNELVKLLIPAIPDEWKALPVSMFGSADDKHIADWKKTARGGVGSTFSDSYGWDAAW